MKIVMFKPVENTWESKSIIANGHVESKQGYTFGGKYNANFSDKIAIMISSVKGKKKLQVCGACF